MERNVCALCAVENANSMASFNVTSDNGISLIGQILRKYSRTILVSQMNEYPGREGLVSNTPLFLIKLNTLIVSSH